MADITDEALIAQYAVYAGMVFEEEEKLKKRLEKIKSGMDGIRATISERLIARKAQNTKTKAGTAYFADHLNIKVVDRDALLAWAQQHWTNGGGAMVVIKPPTESIRDYQAMNSGTNPPGVTTETFTRLNIKLGAQ